MTNWQVIASAWHWHPSVLLGTAALVVGYGAALRFRLIPRAALLFLAGVLMLLVALLSPIHILGDTYLFSAHMLQHLLLVQVVPPLLLLGIPHGVRTDHTRRRTNPDSSFVDRPSSAQPGANGRKALRGGIGRAQALLLWALGIGAMWLWHLPALYNAALAERSVHIVEHLCFLVASLLFWWPIVGPLPEQRLRPLGAAIYLFTAMLASSVLGIILTFTPPGLYPAYLNPVDKLGIQAFICDVWGLTPAVDQQLGGLLMWVPGSLPYLGALLATLAGWYHAPESETSAADAAGHEPRRI